MKNGIGWAVGSPAWAGIDRTWTSRTRTKRWLPRMGGDRPYLDEPYEDEEMAPPHGRG